jgi:hypothetical protein
MHRRGHLDPASGRLPPVPGPQPKLGDRKRQIASVYVWVQVTSGEHHFAPRPIESTQPPEVQKAWQERRNTIWHLMHRTWPGPHYTGLKTELNALAASLARSTDAQLTATTASLGMSSTEPKLRR